jgi:hypothetical protein
METASSAFPSARRLWFVPSTKRPKLSRFPLISACFHQFLPISAAARRLRPQPVSAGFRGFPLISADFASLARLSRPEGRSWPAWETDANARLAEASRTPLAFHHRPEGLQWHAWDHLRVRQAPVRTRRYAPRLARFHLSPCPKVRFLAAGSPKGSGKGRSSFAPKRSTGRVPIPATFPQRPRALRY